MVLISTPVQAGLSESTDNGQDRTALMGRAEIHALA